MSWLYLLLDAGTLFFPVVLSFDKNVHYLDHWKRVLLSTLLIAIPFIAWDIYFTAKGVWGFNPNYLTGMEVYNLPIEEVLFFIVVPFACTFIYQCCKFYLKRFNFNRLNIFMALFIFLYACVVFFQNTSGAYSSLVFISTLIVLLFWIKNFHLNFIGISFIISILPFLVMNGALTGQYTDAPIVWYNDLQNASIRLFTIPVEDVVYCFSLIASNFITFEFLNKRHEENRGTI